MGTQTQQDKAGNKYEVKPQYEELSKQINMQHAINQCYECMRAIKESLGGRHSNPVVTTPTIALDFSDTSQQSASHNVAPNQLGYLTRTRSSLQCSDQLRPPLFQLRYTNANNQIALQRDQLGHPASL
ncbi:mediator-associated protein 1-like [Dorcoceras hygrometricum]|uniref:Mediator-associated protein 1-like n=1 Tax=Dorcoceras hygrometricum TaxID=472368 RepID=A0A2Z7D213_9LAMI|nr:mediator-associated protein 1-like [Dorcoceras hygrometricum]